MNIRLFRPSLGQEELDNIKSSFDRSWVGLGPNVNEFEEQWQKYINVKHAIGVNSATAALHLSLMSFKFPKKKKVLVPSLTFSATATAVLYNDLVPIFVDSDPITLSMDLEDMKRKYDENVVAVMVVHYTGHPAKIDEIVKWAKQKNVKVIEDCAHTVGSKFKGKTLGTWGDFGCYSFEEKKLMTTGDGGMIVTNNSSLIKDLKAMRWVGIDKDNWKTAQSYTDKKRDAMHWFYEINELGYKYNMNDLAAAIGLAQLKKLPQFNKRRSEIILMYMKEIIKMKVIKPLVPFEPKKYNYQMFGVRCKLRDDLIIFLKSKGIATGCHYTPLTLQPLFRKNGLGKCNYIEKESEKFITLPLHSELKNEEVHYIINELHEFDQSH